MMALAGFGQVSTSVSPEGYFRRAALGLPQTIGRQMFVWDKTIDIDGSYNSLRVVADSHFAGFKYTGKGPAFRFKNLKDSSIGGVHLTVTDPEGWGWEFASDGSSSRNQLYDLWGKGGRYFVHWTDLGTNADLSNWTVTNCHGEGNQTAFSIEGANAIAPWVFLSSTATNCVTGWDLTKGGSGVQALQCGGSNTGTLFQTAGGYGFTATGVVSELNGVVWKTGEVDGFGQPTPQKLEIIEARGTKKAIAIIGKAGKVTIDLQTVFGPCVVTAENRSDKTALDILCPNMLPAVSAKGAVKVNGQNVAVAY